MRAKDKNAANENKKDTTWVSRDEMPLYGVEALIGTVTNERELLKELKKAIKHNSNFAKKRFT